MLEKNLSLNKSLCHVIIWLNESAQKLLNWILRWLPGTDDFYGNRNLMTPEQENLYVPLSCMGTIQGKYLEI